MKHRLISNIVTISAFLPAWLSPRMRLSSPDHSPLIARTRVLAIVPAVSQATTQPLVVSTNQVRRLWHISLINPRRACAARVTVVFLCVCLLSHISPLERLFVLKTLSRTQRATKVKIFVGFSLKPLRCRDPALPPLTAIRTVGHFSCGKRHACAL